MKRKITGLFFTFLLCITAANGFCQNENKKLIQLTWEITSSIRDKIDGLDFYFSKSFSIKINEKKNANPYDVSNGDLALNEENSSQNLIDFTMDEKGKLENIDDSRKGREILEIYFPDNPDKKNIRLRFVRNSKNCFELVSAKIDVNNYTFRFPDTPPSLYIRPNFDIPNTEIQAIPFGDGRNLSSQSQQVSTAFSDSTFNNNIQPRKYYIQIGSYTNMNTAYSEIANINCNFPVAVMKANVIIKGKNTLVHRVLIGPLNHNESQNLFKQIKASYFDAFIWYAQ